jgi:hypothetical protein
MTPRQWVGLAARILTLALCALAIVTIPGSVVRSLVFERAPIPPPVTSDHKTAVTLRVRRADSHAQLSGARVRALTMVEGRAYISGSGTTDDRGHLELSALPDAATWFLADDDGYARASTQRVLTGTPLTLDLELSAAHRLSVIVKDDLGAPLAGAEVEVSGGDPLPLGARTDAAGHAIADRLGDGPWILCVHADGYEEAVHRRVREGDAPEVVLRKLGTIVVSVVFPDDRPASEARVQIAGSSLWPARSTETGADGTTRIGALAAGSYALRATSGSLASPIELGVPLGRGEERPVVLKLAPGLYASARVMDGDSDDASPVRGARVTLAEAGLSPFPLEATTDKKGLARLGPIAPGPALLSAQADGYVPRGAIDVPASGATATIVLVRAGVVVGRVVDGRGRPVDGATIEIVGTSASGSPIDDDPRKQSFRRAEFDSTLAGPRPLIPSGELGVVPGPVPPIPHAFEVPIAASAGTNAPSVEEPWVTKEDGTFRAAPASPGRIRVVVRHPEYIDAMSDAVSLAPGGEVHVNVTLHTGGTLEGRVVDAAGRAVGGARVTIAALHGPMERGTRSASDGTFAFAAVPDSVLVTASADEDELSPRVARATLDVPEGGKASVTLKLPEARPALEIHVKDDRGYPVDAAQISVGSVDPAVPFRTTAFTDAHGDALVPGARGISLRLEVTAPGHAGAAASVASSATSADVTLGQAEALTGTVRRARTGQPLAQAEVTLYTDLGARRTETDHDGAFKLADVAPGPARLRVRAPGSVTHVRELSIDDVSGHVTDVGHIELDEEGIIEGTVVDGRGEPVAGARVGKDHVPTYLPATGHVDGFATTDAHGRFKLGELEDGAVTLEGYAPDVGRARLAGVHVSAGRTTSGIVIHLGADTERTNEPAASGGVAVTLGELSGEPREVVLAAVVDGSEAERAGLAQGDVIVEVDGAPVHTIAEARSRLSGPLAEDVVVARRRGETVESIRVPREPVRR